MSADKPAYPFAFDDMEVNRTSYGLNRRELFAAMALQGLLADPNCFFKTEFYAEGAVKLADALIEELDK